jgi:threonine dehydrogenase-like Zn-dependent dehydrogenase
MKALVFHKPKDVRVEEVPDPTLRYPGDAILRVTASSIGGSDLHIYNGYFPQERPTVLGHEFMGVIEAVGPEVSGLEPGDRVVVPAPIADGRCWFCQHGLPTQCEGSNEHYGPEGGAGEKGAAVYGCTDLYGGYAGGQAERVRVAFADRCARKVPDDLDDEQALFLSDVIPTGWAAAEWAGAGPGDTVAVFGCGPVGLMAQKAARVRGASRVIGVDILADRLAMARGCAGSELLDATRHEPVAALREMTDGRGPDACIDAVGLEAELCLREKASAALHLLHGQVGHMKVLQACISAVRRGGRVAVVGEYGTSYDGFPVGQVFDKGLTLRLGAAPVQNYIDQLMDLVREGTLAADDLVTHRFPLSRAAEAYELFNEKKDGCVKVVLRP